MCVLYIIAASVETYYASSTKFRQSWFKDVWAAATVRGVGILTVILENTVLILGPHQI